MVNEDVKLACYMDSMMNCPFLVDLACESTCSLLLTVPIVRVTAELYSDHWNQFRYLNSHTESWARVQFDVIYDKYLWWTLKLHIHPSTRKGTLEQRKINILWFRTRAGALHQVTCIHAPQALLQQLKLHVHIILSSWGHRGVYFASLGPNLVFSMLKLLPSRFPKSFINFV